MNISDFNKLSTGLTIYDASDYKDIKYASNIFEQSYETPYLPSGNIIKFQFLSYYYKLLFKLKHILGFPISINSLVTSRAS